MIMEAVFLNVRREDADAQKAQERDAWKKEQQERLKQEFGS